MSPHTRAMVAAAAYAFVTGKKVAGIYDHGTKRDLQIAAESRGNLLQGFDGDRSVSFGGTLPEIYDAGDRAFVSFEIEGEKVQGYDRGSSTHYTAQVSSPIVQLYDHGESAWFNLEMRDVDSGSAVGATS
ncbi:hypothetical protein ABVV53_12770 [Novosphingobium sp. RD2P27]|uniref:Uncharacterized protein n=1 Tax=Novosphingobium kalidii TaxID=3230299 RepID=A0ABV2D363_9SPHN